MNCFIQKLNFQIQWKPMTKSTTKNYHFLSFLLHFVALQNPYFLSFSIFAFRLLQNQTEHIHLTAKHHSKLHKATISRSKGNCEHTVPSRPRSGVKNSLEIIVPRAYQDWSFEIKRHRLSSLHQKIITITHVLQGSSDPSTADNHSRNHFGSNCSSHGSEIRGGFSAVGVGGERIVRERKYYAGHDWLHGGLFWGSMKCLNGMCREEIVIESHSFLALVYLLVSKCWNRC